jgi:hypothetical protein
VQDNDDQFEIEEILDSRKSENKDAIELYKLIVQKSSI